MVITVKKAQEKINELKNNRINILKLAEFLANEENGKLKKQLEMDADLETDVCNVIFVAANSMEEKIAKITVEIENATIEI